MVHTGPAWIWKIFTMLVAIASPRGDYGHGGPHRPVTSNTLPGPPSTTGSIVSSSSSRIVGPTGNQSNVTKSASPTTDSTGISNSTTSKRSTTTSARPTSTLPPLPQQKCPEGSSWFVVEDAMSSVSDENWSLDAANHAKINFDDGMKMTLNQTAGNMHANPPNRPRWIAPVTVEADIKSTGVGGVPSTLTMKGKGDAGAEIDLELVTYQLKNQQKPTYQMQLPIWKPSNKYAVKLRKDGSELAAKTANGCYEDKVNPAMSEWAYTYPNYDARAWVAYKLEWFPNQIKWYTAGLERVAFENKQASSYPRTPLPLQIGPWAISKNSNPEVTWAGDIDWVANPNPSMSVKNVRISGCRAN
ncbi:glycoside hydrolase family 16 protein [Cystobasidium minutum MCA 4210]|uniref:glycoside hydrolase family 16 protein n=1 Tax=Cystobasidium minutum MCA 4210 TaxID=1397322 RepID=UPI0034CF4EA2|eukprot:jgi/Rhomi1/189136/estExt_fgenesh1_pg.C_3_t20094